MLSEEYIKESLLRLPKDYQEFLLSKNQGAVENDFNYLLFYSREEIYTMNGDIETHEFFPGFIFIGQTDNGTYLGYNLNDLKLYSLPPISDVEDALFISNNFTEFMERFEREEIEIY